MTSQLVTAQTKRTTSRIGACLQRLRLLHPATQLPSMLDWQRPWRGPKMILSRRILGTSGVPICRSGPGAPYGRTTAPAAIRETTFPMIMRGLAPTGGTKTAWRACRTSGISCASVALWNGVDSILKERMFGLTGPQGNHGEDVKEYWWYLDALRSHTWLRWRYHYPQAAFPYQQLLDKNSYPRRNRNDSEFELLDTGVFDDGRYWVVEVAYAKASATEILAKITIENKGPDEATLSVLPTLWFRNTWRYSGAEPPELREESDAILVQHPHLSGYRLDAAPTLDGTSPKALFCDNETNTARLFGAAPITTNPKDGINDHVISGADTVNPEQRGTKACWWYPLTVPAKGTSELRRRLHRPESTSATSHWSVSHPRGAVGLIEPDTGR